MRERSFPLRTERLSLALALIMGTLSLAPQPASATTPTVRDSLWIANSRVRATAVLGNTLYLGGDFSYLGPVTGHGAAIDASTGEVDLGLPRINAAGDAVPDDNPNATVEAAVSDGSGGWFVGGLFDRVGGVGRNNLVHIKADHTVDAAWNPAPNGAVQGLAASGSTLYVAGEFTSIGGEQRNRIAALDVATGVATPWDPNADAGVRDIAIVGATAYVGGLFNAIGGQPRSKIAALDIFTGRGHFMEPAGGRIRLCQFRRRVGHNRLCGRGVQQRGR